MQTIYKFFAFCVLRSKQSLERLPLFAAIGAVPAAGALVHERRVHGGVSVRARATALAVDVNDGDVCPVSASLVSLTGRLTLASQLLALLWLNKGVRRSVVFPPLPARACKFSSVRCASKVVRPDAAQNVTNRLSPDDWRPGNFV